jgi:CPA1 family monovalent cation:H+ antiporter
VAFLANSLVFLLIGLQVNIPALIADWQSVVWAIAAVLVARVVVVYSLSWLAGFLAEPIPMPWQHVLTWGGLRGAISLALALSLPEALGTAVPQLRTMAFGVVLFSLLVQGLTMGRLVRWLKIVTRGKSQVEYEVRHARLTALRAADARLDRLHSEGLLSTPTWESLKPLVTQDAASLAEAVRESLAIDPGLAAEELDTGWRELLRAQRSALQSLQGDGVISEDVFEQLVADLDARLQEGPPDLPLPDAKPTRTQVLTVAVDSALADKAIAGLALPPSVLLVSIQRGKEVIIPHGDTQLLAGDVITAVYPADHEGQVSAILNARLMAPPAEPATGQSDL